MNLMRMNYAYDFHGLSHSLIEQYSLAIVAMIQARELAYLVMCAEDDSCWHLNQLEMQFVEFQVYRSIELLYHFYLKRDEACGQIRTLNKLDVEETMKN